MPVVFRVTSVPVVDESLPALVVQVQVARAPPTIEARKTTRSPSVTDDCDAMMLHVTVGHGGSVTSKEAVQLDSPLVTQPDGWSVFSAVTVIVAVTE